MKRYLLRQRLCLRQASPTPTQPGGFLSWRTQTGGAMRVAEVSSARKRIKTNLPFDAPLPDYARQDIAPTKNYYSVLSATDH
jgi:hypothetical protein